MIAAVMVAERPAVIACRVVVRRFEPRLDGPRRAPKRTETHALSWENAVHAQVYLEGRIQRTTCARSRQLSLVTDVYVGD